MPDLATLISILDLAVRDRAQLALENAALRHQLAVLKRSETHPVAVPHLGGLHHSYRRAA